MILSGNGLEWRYGIDIDGADYWTIQDLKVHDYIREGLRGCGFVSWSVSRNITLRNLEFSLVGTPIKFHEGGADIVIENIYAHDYDYGGFDCGPAGPGVNITIRRFTAIGPGTGDDTAVDGFAVEEGSNILVEDCIAEGHPGDGFDFKSDNTTLRRVISRDNARNNLKLWGQNSRLENCLSYDSGLTNLVLAEGGSYTITNCLFANCETYGYLAVVGYDQPLDTPLRLYNTIFYNDNPMMGGTMLFLGEGVALTADYNLYFNPYRENAIICAAFLGGQCFSKDSIIDGTWFMASGCGEHSSYADPSFVNATAHNYRLRSESPAVDAGTAEYAPQVDLDGNVRPQGGGYDVGPYEFQDDLPGMVWVDDDFDEHTPGWGYDHFKVIQDGVDAVAEGGTVSVQNGTYQENVFIEKALTLTGDDKTATVVDGGGSNDVLYISANGVNITRCTLRNGGEEGVYLENADYCCIDDCIVSGNGDVGILLNRSTHTMITCVIIHNNTYDGVLLENAHYTAILNNTVYWNGVTSNGEGILLMNSDYCLIDNNTVYENGESGIILEPASSTNTVSSNTVYGNKDCGILLSAASNFNIVSNNEVHTNTYDGILVEYSHNNSLSNNTLHHNVEEGIVLLSCSNHTIINNIGYNNSAGIALYASTRSDLGNNILSHNAQEGVVLWNCSNNNSVRENNISYNQWGIEIGYSAHNRILDNDVLHNYYGIEIDSSTAITAENNTLCGNNYYGIELVNASNNDIIANHIFSTFNNGIDLWYNATGNRIHDNRIEGSGGWGIELGVSSNNDLYNNYLNNTNNAWDDGNNRWNVTKREGPNIIGGPSIGGNYWGDYHGVDVNDDGFGETPYGIEDNSNWDYLPLVAASIKNATITIPETKSYASTCVRLQFVVEPHEVELAWIGYSLDGGANVNITGNTTIDGLGAGEHTIVVCVRDEGGNNVTSTTVHFTVHPGDISSDNVVNIFDLQRLAWAFLSHPGDANWNDAADLNCDSTVNIFDLQILAWNFMNSYT